MGNINDDYIYIEKLEIYTSRIDKTMYQKLTRINKWTINDIIYELSLLDNKSAHQTFRDKKGECRDKLVLGMFFSARIRGQAVEVFCPDLS